MRNSKNIVLCSESYSHLMLASMDKMGGHCPSVQRFRRERSSKYTISPAKGKPLWKSLAEMLYNDYKTIRDVIKRDMAARNRKAGYYEAMDEVAEYAGKLASGNLSLQQGQNGLSQGPENGQESV